MSDLGARRLLMLGEVAAFAKKDCRPCHGLGFLTKVAAGDSRELIPCGCAARRFQKRHGGDVEGNALGTMMFWKEGRAPVGSLAGVAGTPA